MDAPQECREAPHKAPFRAAYGDDSRFNVYELGDTDGVADIARAVAMLVPLDRVVDTDPDDGVVEIAAKHDSLISGYDLCADQPFALEPAIDRDGITTGVLVGPDTVLTAADGPIHWAPDREALCAATAIVFDYAYYRDPGDDYAEALTINDDAVYRCKEVVHLAFDDTTATCEGRKANDLVLRLDRWATGREPVDYDRGAALDNGMRVFGFSHPLGGPLKLSAGDATLRGRTNEILFNDLDVYRPASGHPMFDEHGTLLGIGACFWGADLVPGGNCSRMAECGYDFTCPFNEAIAVARIADVLDAIEPAPGGGPPPDPSTTGGGTTGSEPGPGATSDEETTDSPPPPEPRDSCD